MSWKSRSRRTFSMIELLVSIIVVAVIIAIAIVAYNAFIDNARQAAGEATTAQVVKTLQTYSAQENIAVVYAYPAPSDPGFTAVAADPADGELVISSLEYSDRVPGEVEKLRVAPEGTVAVVTADGVLCTTGAFGLEPGSAPASGPVCGDAVAPGDPSGLSAVPSNAQVLLSWTAPETVVQDYVVSYSPDGSAWSTFNDGVSTDTSVLVTGLTNGTEYQFRVVATNDVGSSAPLTTAATPFTVPDPPTALLATAGLESVTVAWTAPVFDGGRPVDSYTVTSSPGDLTCTTATTSCVVEGLTAGEFYEFTVVAVNEAGASTPAGPVAPTQVPFTTTSAPGPLAAVLGAAGGEVDLSWGPPVDDGYSDVTDYVVEYKLAADASWTVFTHPVSTTPSVTVTGLTVGEEYDFRVKAVTAVSPNTNPYTQTASPLVTALAPDPATGLMVTPADSSVTMSWDEVVSTPQKPVTGYRIYAYNTVSSLWEFKAQTSSLTVDIPAVNGVTVSYRMATFGPGGEGPASASVDGTARTIPGAPTSLDGTVSDASVALTWVAPVDNGGAPVTDYAIQYRTAAGPGAWTTFNDGPSTTPSVTVTGLTNGTAYDFRVAAVNAAGAGSYTPVAGPYTPITTPSAPTGLSGTPASTQVTLSWAAPNNGGSAITDYIIQYRTSPAGAWTTFTDSTSTATSVTVNTLTNGTAYDFRVAAVNAAGTGTYTAAAGPYTPFTTPGAPLTLSGIASNAQVALTWTAPSNNGGSAISDYVVQYRISPAGAWTTFADGTSTSLSTTVTGLTNGTAYDFRVAPVNGAGTGSYTTAGPYTPVTTPGAPTGVTASPGEGTMTVSWTAPSNGGAAITSYQVLASNGATCITASASCSINITVAATYQVRAQNSVGWGSYSAATASTSPFNVANGGTVTTVSNYNGTGQTWKVHTFTSAGTFTATSAARGFSILVVGAGSPGGSGLVANGGGYAGGGGAGGKYLYNASASLSAAGHGVTVGTNGGASTLGAAYSSASGSNGGAANSPGVTYTITGSSVGYAGGGGNGAYDVSDGNTGNGKDGAPGYSGGGQGGYAQADYIAYYSAGSPGVRGGGGGGGAGANSFHGNGSVSGGGSTGIVIVAYRIG